MTPNNNRGGAPPVSQTRKEAADEADLSRDQRHQAQRVANVPAQDFEAAIEAPEPATVTELARRSRAR